MSRSRFSERRADGRRNTRRPTVHTLEGMANYPQLALEELETVSRVTPDAGPPLPHPKVVDTTPLDVMGVQVSISAQHFAGAIRSAKAYLAGPLRS